MKTIIKNENELIEQAIRSEYKNALVIKTPTNPKVIQIVSDFFPSHLNWFPDCIYVFQFDTELEYIHKWNEIRNVKCWKMLLLNGVKQ